LPYLVGFLTTLAILLQGNIYLHGSLFFFLLGNIQADGGIYGPELPGCNLVSVTPVPIPPPSPHSMPLTFHSMLTGTDFSQSSQHGVRDPTVPQSSHHGVSDPQSPFVVFQETRWSDKEVCIFLQICKEEDVQNVSAADKNPHKWQRVCDKLKEKFGGGKRTKDMCKNKWGKLKADYLKWKDSQSQTGTGKTNFKFQAQLEEMLGDQHHVRPTFLIGSSGVIPTTSLVSGNSADSSARKRRHSSANHHMFNPPSQPSSSNGHAFHLHQPSSSPSLASIREQSHIHVLPSQSPSGSTESQHLSTTPKKSRLSVDLSQSLLTQQNELLERNAQQAEALNATLRDGFMAIADALRYLADSLPKSSI
jgi:hypothetical protein